jgi:subtilisin family serine protease
MQPSLGEIMKVKATVLHIEDDCDWIDEVLTLLRDRGELEFKNYINRFCIDDAVSELRSLSGPIILIMDLRYDDLRSKTRNYNAYYWIMDEIDDFRYNNASVSTFIISGHLNDLAINSLVNKGIPSTHIFGKDSWAENRENFLKLINEVVENIDGIAQENIEKGISGKNLDPYLIHSFEEETSEEGSYDSSEANIIATSLPMVIQTSNENWDYSQINGLRVLGQIKNIYSCIGTSGSLLDLERDSSVVRVEASRPITDFDCDRSLPLIKADLVHNKVCEKGDKALIAIIDTGIDILHEAFLDRSGESTRIMAIWDQRDPTGPSPILRNNKELIGTIYNQDQINEFIKNGSVPIRLKSSLHDHGTHVASIAAGRPTKDFFGGVAPEAKILIVIPDPSVFKITDRPYSLGYSDSHLLALEFIREFAENKKMPVVINVSQGMNAGAHDGSSVLEKGFDLITDDGQAPGIIVVKSAGNERDKCIHSKLQMVSNSCDNLDWISKYPHNGKDVIEVWFTGEQKLKFSLIDPEGEETSVADASHPVVKQTFSSGNKAEMTYSKYINDNGDCRLLLSITNGSALDITKGYWSLAIESGTLHSTNPIHAWIERNDSRPIEFTNHLSEDVTISIPGTSFYVLTVGSVKPLFPFRQTKYSSYGPTRDLRNKPDISAPGDGILAAKSNSKYGVIEMSGTSMAAPHVSGSIALVFSAREKQKEKNPHLPQFNAAQIRGAIIQGSQGFNSTWHPGIGFGILDTEKVLKELDLIYE